MKKLTLTLETVTPLFLGGAEAREKNQPPELRPPAFRGVMRYWFRAVLGGVIGDNNIEGLHKLETVIFGSTEISSAISIRLIGMGPPKTSPQPILPHKPGSGQRNAFNSGEKFRLIMQQNHDNEIIWGNACMALNVALMFGGIGLRSRRGYGSLRILSTDNNLVPKTPNEWQSFPKRISSIGQNAIDWARVLAENYQVKSRKTPNAPTQFPSAAHGVVTRLVKIDQNSPHDACKYLMERLPQTPVLGGINPRQVSPLWARIIFADQKYQLMLTVLPSELAYDLQDYSEVRAILDKNFRPSPSMPDLVIKGWNS